MSEIQNTVWTLPPSMRGVTDSKFYLSSSSLDNASPWTGERPKSDPFLQVWMAEMTFPAAPEVRSAARDAASWRERMGFITRARGTAGCIRVADTFRLRPMYDLNNNPSLADWSDSSKWSDGSQWTQGALPPFVTLDDTAIAGADSFVLRGLPANKEEVLSPGDLIEMRPNGVPTPYGNLYEIVHCSRSNSDGKARVYIQPGLCQRFVAGDMAVLREPTCVFRLSDKNQGIMARSMDRIGRHGISLIEQKIDA